MKKLSYVCIIDDKHMDTRAFFSFIDALYAFNGQKRTVDAFCLGKIDLVNGPRLFRTREEHLRLVHLPVVLKVLTSESN